MRFDGRALLGRPEPELRRLRGGELAMIFQEPMTSLNPVLTVGDQIAEAIRLHEPVSAAAARRRAAAMLDRVSIPESARRARQYPHQLSGGMRQRVMIGMARACRPRLLITDEPTTALDVTVQAQILELMKELQRELGTAILLITHDLGVVRHISDRVGVMYLGKLVELAPAPELFRAPLHPYTAALLAAIPLPHPAARRWEPIVLGGELPSPVNPPRGCRFHTRCPFAGERCREEEPPRWENGPGHWAACHYPL